jgi:hypothetical protein
MSISIPKADLALKSFSVFVSVQELEFVERLTTNKLVFLCGLGDSAVRILSSQA